MQQIFKNVAVAVLNGFTRPKNYEKISKNDLKMWALQFWAVLGR